MEIIYVLILYVSLQFLFARIISYATSGELEFPLFHGVHALLIRLEKRSQEIDGITLNHTGFTSEEKAAEIEQFFKDNEAPFADRTIKQSLETIRLNAKWLQRDREDVAKFLESV